MKICPRCRLEYFDDSLHFCLEDGTRLVHAVPNGNSLNEPATIRLADRSVPVFPDGLRSDPQAETLTMSGFVPNSIVVLPFTRLSSDPDDEYFCDGLSEELISALSRIDGLKVVARTSAFSFKGRNLDVAHVGSILNVSNIVEGSVRKAGDRMRISVQLINTSDGYSIWSEKYDTEIRDIFEVRDTITYSVVKALKNKLLDAQAEKDDKMSGLIEELKHHVHTVEAYQLYLRGRFLFSKFNEPDLYRALECFEQAIVIEPNFAEAYSGKADVYMWLTELGPLAALEGMPMAKEAALKAISLNPGLSEAHTSLGIVLQEFDYDFRKAEEEYKKAIDLNLNNALAFQMYGSLLAQLGRFDEANERFERSLVLDPLSPMGSWIYPFGLFLERRYLDSIDRANKILELDGNFAAGYLILSFDHHLLGNLEACKENYCRFLDIFGLNSVASEARAGFDAGGWDGFLRAMTEPHVRAAVSFYITAVYFSALGNIDAAVECLEQSFDKREGHIVMLNVDPRFDALREDPRFQRIINDVGFPSASH